MTTLVNQIKKISQDNMDWKLGTINAVFMVPFAIYVNSNQDIIEGFTTGMNQLPFSLIVGSFTFKLCENLSTKYESKAKSLILGTIVPALTYSAFLYSYHDFRGTSNPFATALPSVMLGIPADLGYGYYRRTEQEIQNGKTPENMIHKAIQIISKLEKTIEDLTKIPETHPENQHKIEF